MTDAGLRVRSDGMGNIFGRWEGSLPAERARRPAALAVLHRLMSSYAP
jgi:hypothetical protein